MVRKHSILPRIILVLTLLLLAALHLPGVASPGISPDNDQSKNNKLVSLINNKAINELDNPSRLSVICGFIFFLNK